MNSQNSEGTGQESQPYSGLHQMQCGQQVEGGDSATLLHSGESPPGVLCPAPELSAQDRRGPVGAGPEEGCQNGLRAGTPLQWGKAERVGAVQPGEKKAAGTPYCSLLVPEGAYKRGGEGLFTRGNVFKLKGVVLD